MEHWYRHSWNKVVKDLGSDIYKGLTSEEVELRKQKYGNNKVDIQSYNKYLLIGKLLLQLWLVLAIVQVYILLSEGNNYGGAIVLVIALIGFTVQVMDSVKNYKKAIKIKKRYFTTVRVQRDGRTCAVKSEEIVLGDIIMLQKGSIVPADIRIIESEKLFVMESSITGETVSVEKYSTKIDEEIYNISNIKNILFRSSVVTEGNCLGIAVAVGMDTVDSGILKAMNKIELEEDTVIRKSKLNLSLHMLLVLIVSGLCALGAALYGYSSAETIVIFKGVFFSGTLFASVFSGIMMIMLIKVHINNGEVKLLKPSSVFNLLEIDILTMEKFGTISDKNIVFKEIYTDGTGYFPNLSKEQWTSNVERIFQSLVICNSYSELSNRLEEDYNYTIDKSVKLYIEEVLKYELEPGKYKRVFINPYDNERRLMTYVYKVEENYRAYSKGLLDSIINRCTSIMKNGIEVEISKEDLEDIKHKAVTLESKGLFVLAVAYRNFTYEPTPVENVESNMVFVGLIALKNEIFENASKYMTEIRKNHIRPVFFTEETKLSAYTWGKRLGIVKNTNEVLSGIEMDNMSKEEYKNYCSKLGIYSKLTPGNKSQVIKTYSEKNVKTAFICRGTADLAPAVYADYNIVFSERNLGVICDISNIQIKNNLINNLLSILSKVKLYIEQLNRANEFILTYLFAQMLLSVYMSFIDVNQGFDYTRIIWIGIFNFPLLLLIILLDTANFSKQKMVTYEHERKTIKPKFIKAYVKGIILTAVSIAVYNILSIFLNLEVAYYLIFNLLLTLLVNFYRVKNKSVVSLGNLLYCAIIIFNLILIFIINN